VIPLRRLVGRWAIALGLLLCVASVRAGSLSDLWWVPSEPGWGMNVVQQHDVLFVTLFVYDADGKATWYVGSRIEKAMWYDPYYSGPLQAMSGPPSGGSFDPDAVTRREVGTLTFTPNADGTARVTYTVDGRVVDKTVRRQTWRRIPLFFIEPWVVQGTFQVAEISISRCAVSDMFMRAGSFTLSATPTGELSGRIALQVEEMGLAFTGTYLQSGSVFEVTWAAAIAQGSGSFLPPGDYSGGASPLVVDGEFVHGYVKLSGSNGCRVAFAFAGRMPVVMQGL
jgi:hypothetical protein